jgi:hypothetical protein
MSLDEFLYQLSETIVVSVLFGLLLHATEAGFRRARLDSDSRWHDRVRADPIS